MRFLPFKITCLDFPSGVALMVKGFSGVIGDFKFKFQRGQIKKKTENNLPVKKKKRHALIGS